MRIGSIRIEAIGNASSAANDAASTAWRTAAGLLRVSHAPRRPSVAMRVALPRIDATSELLNRSIALSMIWVMTVSYFHCGRGQSQLSVRRIRRRLSVTH